MILVDSNVIINSTKPEHKSLIKFLAVNDLCISAITKIEVLGYPKIPDSVKEALEAFFTSTPTHPISDRIIDKAIELRQSRKMSLGDSIIAATALMNELDLATSNIKDFKWIESLNLINPLEK